MASSVTYSEIRQSLLNSVAYTRSFFNSVAYTVGALVCQDPQEPADRGHGREEGASHQSGISPAVSVIRHCRTN